MLKINMIPADLRRKHGSAAFLTATLGVLLAAIGLVSAALALLPGDKPNNAPAGAPGSSLETVKTPSSEERKKYIDETVDSVRELLKAQRYADAAAAASHGVARVESWRTPDGKPVPDAAAHRKTLDDCLATAERLQSQRDLRLKLNSRSESVDESEKDMVVVRYNGTRFQLPRERF